MTRLLLAVALCGITGCSSFPGARSSELTREGIYAAHDAIDAGRVDLADDYLAGVVKLVPPPKRRVVVKPIVSRL